MGTVHALLLKLHLEVSDLFSERQYLCCLLSDLCLRRLVDSRDCLGGAWFLLGHTHISKFIAVGELSHLSLLVVKVVLVLHLLVGSPYGPQHLASVPSVCVLDELVHLLVTAIFVVQLVLHVPVLARDRHPVLHSESSPRRVFFEQGFEGGAEYDLPFKIRQDGQRLHWSNWYLLWHFNQSLVLFLCW